MPIHGDQLNWNAIFYFVEVAEAGSIRAAAEKLDLSSSTLSEHLSGLESDLAVRLFRRHYRGMTLTEEGAKLYRHAKQMFGATKRFIDTLSPLPLGHYPVCAGLTPEAAHAASYAFIYELAIMNLESSLHVSSCFSKELERELVEGTFDFGITASKPEDSDIVHVPIGSSAIAFFVSPDLAQRPLREMLLDLPLITCETENQPRSLTDRILSSLNVHPARRLTSHYPSLAIDLCQRGAGVALLPTSHVRGSHSLRKVESDIPITDSSESIYVVWSKHSEATDVAQKIKAVLQNGSEALGHPASDIGGHSHA